MGGQPDEYVEFDAAALLRSDQKDRIDALVRGVQGGIYSPNEARNLEGYDNVAYGDEPCLQAQVVPLSAAGSIPSTDTAPAAPAAAIERQARVRREFDAMTARVKRPALNGTNKLVIRKTKMNGLQHAANFPKQT